MAIYKRGKKYYSSIYLDGKRVRVPLSHSKAVAQIKEAEMQKRKLAHQDGVSLRRITWTEFKAEYFAWAATPKAAGTLKWELLACKHMEGMFPPLGPEDVTLAYGERLQGHLKALGLKVSGNNRLVRAMKVIQKRAAAQRYCAPVDWRQLRLLKEPVGKVYYWTKADYARLLQASRGANTIILNVGGRAGLRAAEIFHLEWSDCDFERRIIYVRHKPGWHTKTMMERSVPMTEPLAKFLLKLRKSAPGSHVLAGAKYKERLDLASYQTMFYRFTKAAGLPGDIRKLRHTFASHCREAGVPIEVLQQWMGHKRLATTMIYAHIGQDHLHRHIDALSSYVP
jgi:integrase